MNRGIQNLIKQIFIKIVLVLFLTVKFSFVQEIKRNLYPASLQLESGNLFIVLNSGIYLFSPDFSPIKIYYQFSKNETVEKNERVEIKQFPKEEGSFIAILNKKKVYICSENTFEASTDLSSFLYGEYFSLVPFGHDDEYNNFFYTISFTNEYEKLDVLLCSFNNQTKISTVNLHKKNVTEENLSILPSCERMHLQNGQSIADLNKDSDDFLACSCSVKSTINIDFIKVNLTEIKRFFRYTQLEFVNFDPVLTKVNPDKTRLLICSLREYNVNLTCYKLDISGPSLTDINWRMLYKNNNFKIGSKCNLDFINETNVFVLSCINDKETKIIEFNEKLDEVGSIYSYRSRQCDVINSFSLIFHDNEYFSINDCIIGSKDSILKYCPLYELNCEIKFEGDLTPHEETEEIEEKEEEEEEIEVRQIEEIEETEEIEEEKEIKENEEVGEIEEENEEFEKMENDDEEKKGKDNYSSSFFDVLIVIIIIIILILIGFIIYRKIRQYKINFEKSKEIESYYGRERKISRYSRNNSSKKEEVDMPILRNMEE